MIQESDEIKDVSQWLGEWRQDLLRGSSNDPLIHLDLNAEKYLNLNAEQLNTFVLPLNVKTNKIIKEQKDYWKNAGIQSLCLVREVLIWKDQDRIFHSPLMLHNCSFSVDKIAQTLTISVAESGFVNPFLEKIFAQKFDQILSEWLLKSDFPADWGRQTVQVLGNFHYHRFVLLRDYDDYQRVEELTKTPLGYYFQEKSAHFVDSKESSQHTIFPMDSDQQLVFDAVASGNHVLVEGPPGSGKSQVLTNLLFDAAQNEKSVVLCSEKMTALQVVEDKLAHKELALFCQNLNVDATAFVKSLETTWSELEKRTATAPNFIQNPNVFVFKRDALQLKLDRLATFPILKQKVVEPPYELSYYPDWGIYLQFKTALLQLNKNFRLLTGNDLKSSVFVYLKSFVFADQQSMFNCIQQVARGVSLLQKCQFHFLNLSTYKDLERVQRILLHAQILTQELFRKNPDLFVENTKIYKKFNKDYQKFQERRKYIELYDQKEGFKWLHPWSEQELHSAKHSFLNDKFWSSNFRKWKKKFELNYRPVVFSRALAIAAIESCLTVIDQNTECQKILDDFQKLGIQSVEIDVPIVLHLQRQINQNLEGLKATQHRFKPEELTVLLQHESDLRELYRFVNQYLILNESIVLFDLFAKLQNEKEFLIGQRELILNLLEIEPQLRVIVPQIQDFNVLDEVVLWGAVRQFEQRNPALFHYTAQDLTQDLEKLIELENQHFDSEIETLWNKKIKRFLSFHELITNNSAKLSDADKEFRKTLKTGRALLIKEFNKTRQHKSIRELFESDAAPWIELLKPILLINPLMVAKVLPNKAQLVDLMLFDEASQIPFSHAVPAIFRAKQIAVFGDSKQLSPSSFFLQGGAQRADLLTESRHFLPVLALKYHYRSLHESLIAYSNRFFYENRLTVLPAVNNPMTDGVFCHFVEGLYQDGKNEIEAIELIDFLETSLRPIADYERVGLVAFSEKQLHTLEEQIKKRNSNMLNIALENEQLMLTTLEKVQGDEFDVLLISLGYGRDADGNFALRFGPVNHDGGDKRLNVLFTRARRALHFFHSVCAQDFGVSENIGVQALKNFLLMHENREFTPNSTEAHKHHPQTLEIIDPFYQPKAVNHLMILLRHASRSGLKVHIKFWKD